MLNSKELKVGSATPVSLNETLAHQNRAARGRVPVGRQDSRHLAAKVAVGAGLGKCKGELVVGVQGLRLK
jgi:hypothetical protein